MIKYKERGNFTAHPSPVGPHYRLTFSDLIKTIGGKHQLQREVKNVVGNVTCCGIKRLVMMALIKMFTDVH